MLRGAKTVSVPLLFRVVNLVRLWIFKIGWTQLSDRLRKFQSRRWITGLRPPDRAVRRRVQ
jgi:hypothetical protein